MSSSLSQSAPSQRSCETQSYHFPSDCVTAHCIVHLIAQQAAASKRSCDTHFLESTPPSLLFTATRNRHRRTFRIRSHSAVPFSTRTPVVCTAPRREIRSFCTTFSVSMCSLHLSSPLCMSLHRHFGGCLPLFASFTLLHLSSLLISSPLHGSGQFS